MSSGMSEEVLGVKSKVIDDLEEDFHRKLKQFTKDVKTTMKVASRQAAVEVFEFALVFLTQAFPDLSNLEASASGERKDETVKLLEENFEKLSKRLSDVEADIQPGLPARLNDLESKVPGGLSNRLSDMETKIQDSRDIKKVSEKLNDLEAAIEDKICQKDFAELSETCHSNSQGITGLRKLLQLLKLKPGSQNVQATAAAAAATTATTTAATTIATATAATTTATATASLASSQGSASAATATAATTTATASLASSQGSASAATGAPCKYIRGLRLRSTFSAQIVDDPEVPEITDIALLDGNLIVLVDNSNSCLKVFNTAGQLISRRILNKTPSKLAVLSLWPPCFWNVAVTLPDSRQIVLFKVMKTSAVPEGSVTTLKPCWEVAAVDQFTLAVTYWNMAGIDLINLSGQVFRRLSSSAYPNNMRLSPDGYLLVSEVNGNIIKINLADKSVYHYNNNKLQKPGGIAFPHQDASCIVTDQGVRTLHLFSSSGVWVQKLWEHPDGGNRHDWLRSVTILGDRCACCTERGTIFFMEVLYYY